MKRSPPCRLPGPASPCRSPAPKLAETQAAGCTGMLEGLLGEGEELFGARAPATIGPQRAGEGETGRREVDGVYVGPLLNCEGLLEEIDGLVALAEGEMDLAHGRERRGHERIRLAHGWMAPAPTDDSWSDGRLE
jgi:hypothetical protein